MKIDFAARVEIGTKETNDDRVLIDGQILDTSSRNGELLLPAIAVVCDGCGGYDGGGIAAQTVLELLSYETPESLGDTNYLSQVLDNCTQAVLKKKIEMPSYSKMCTTIAGCIFLNNSIILFHSGDSRVYRYDGWVLARMTVDHSAVQQMIDMGQITEEEALTSPNRNVITRCIGVPCPPPEIYVANTAIAPGEKFLLCSDGLWESVSAEQIKEILSRDIPIDEIVDVLVETALNQGSDDNISACICAARGNTITNESKPFILE